MSSELLAEDLFRRASESIEVTAPPIQDIVELARARRRRRWMLGGVGVAVAAVVIAALTWQGARPAGQPTEPDPAVVIRSANPIDVAWYAEGMLHLDDVVVALPTLTDFGEVNGGAVYGDESGNVAFVSSSGEQRLIGTKVVDAPVVVSTAKGWAAWLEPTDEGARLVAWDALRGVTVAEQLVDADTRLVAIDQDRVYYSTPVGDYLWTPLGGTPEQLDRSGLVDVEAGTRVYQDGRQIDMVQPFFSVEYRAPGIGALLSPGGTYVITTPARREQGQAFKPILYDVRSGQRLPAGFDSDELAIGATFGDNTAVIYLVIAEEDINGPEALVVLRTCEIGADTCSDVLPIQTDQGWPMLGG